MALVGDPRRVAEGRTASMLPRARHNSMFPMAAMGADAAREAAVDQAQELGIEVPKAPRVPKLHAS